MSSFKHTDTIEVHQNLSIVVRERGKIVARRDGHNIWVNLGREYLAGLVALKSFSPDVPERNDRIKYMGFGIGGNRQLISPVPAPVGTIYTGTNLQSDDDPTIIQLERPVRIAGSVTAYPGIAGDTWLGLIQAPATHDTPFSTTFTRLFGQLEISYSSFLSVPLSEIGLYTSAADPGQVTNTFVAYQTFDSLSKSVAIDGIEVSWSLRF